ncbi:unnamed protein product, partial [Discosporangium mesarthrocarpum]
DEKAAREADLRHGQALAQVGGAAGVGGPTGGGACDDEVSVEEMRARVYLAHLQSTSSQDATLPATATAPALSPRNPPPTSKPSGGTIATGTETPPAVATVAAVTSVTDLSSVSSASVKTKAARAAVAAAEAKSVAEAAAAAADALAKAAAKAEAEAHAAAGEGEGVGQGQGQELEEKAGECHKETPENSWTLPGDGGVGDGGGQGLNPREVFGSFSSVKGAGGARASRKLSFMKAGERGKEGEGEGEREDSTRPIVSATPRIPLPAEQDVPVTRPLKSSTQQDPPSSKVKPKAGASGIVGTASAGEGAGTGGGARARVGWTSMAGAGASAEDDITMNSRMAMEMLGEWFEGDWGSEEPRGGDGASTAAEVSASDQPAPPRAWKLPPFEKPGEGDEAMEGGGGKPAQEKSTPAFEVFYDPDGSKSVEAASAVDLDKDHKDGDWEAEEEKDQENYFHVANPSARDIHQPGVEAMIFRELEVGEEVDSDGDSERDADRGRGRGREAGDEEPSNVQPGTTEPNNPVIAATETMHEENDENSAGTRVRAADGGRVRGTNSRSGQPLRPLEQSRPTRMTNADVLVARSGRDRGVPAQEAFAQRLGLRKAEG